MRRLTRVMRVALVIGATFAPGVAWAQTTTTTTTTTSSSSTTTSTVAPTTTTTLVNPCAGQPCTDEPPGVVLSTATAEIEAHQGSYCWRLQEGSQTRCLALALAPDYKPPVLVVTEGETVTVRFTPPVPGVPQQVSFANNGVLTPLTAANPTSFRVDLPAGVHENLALITRWLQGEVPYGFRLDVRRAATSAPPSDGRVIALTG